MKTNDWQDTIAMAASAIEDLLETADEHAGCWADVPARLRALTAPPAPAVEDGSARQEAEHVASILELIGSFEADDIDGDTVDLRFELDGVDTGSDASITEYASRGSAVINQLLRILATQPVSSGYKLPEGFKLMPIEITDEIAEAIAMEARCCGGIALCIYEAALAAAPEGGS